MLNACRRSLQLGCVLTLVCYAAAGVRAETRTWTDSTGKFKIEADFLEIVEGQVKLQRPDGKKVSLPLAKLSKDDQAYLQQLMKNRRGGAVEEANPFNADDADRPAPAGSRPAARSRRNGDSSGWQEGDRVEVRDGFEWHVGEIVGFDPKWDRVFVKLEDGGRMIEAHDDEHSLRHYDPALGSGGAGVAADVDVSSIRRIIPLGGDSGEFKPDPAPQVNVDWKPRPVGLNPKSGFFESVVGVSFASAGTAAAIGHTGGAEPRDEQSRIEICDLKSGRVVAQVEGPPRMKFVAVSPSGKRLATISEIEAFNYGPVQIWEVNGKQLNRLTGWNVGAKDMRRQVEWIGWVDEQRLISVNSEGLTMWSVDGPRGEYHITGSGMKSPAFSPGGKQFAIGTDDGVSIHDVASGELLTMIPMDHGFERQVAFSPSGRLLASASGSTVEIYDATNGEKGIEAYSGSGDARKGVCWLDEEHVLVGGSDLIHLPSQMTVWTYEHNAENVVPRAGRIWYVFGGRGDDALALLPFDLPHAAVKPVSDQELILRPGDEVAIQLELTFDLGQSASGNAASPQEQLTTALTEAGFLIAENSPKRLIARTLPGETKDIEYRMFGAPFGQTQKASYTQRVFELELVVDGQSVWKRRRVLDAPFHIQLKENESVDQAINRELQADIGFFRSTIPSRILPAAAEKARTSKLSTSGLR